MTNLRFPFKSDPSIPWANRRVSTQGAQGLSTPRLQVQPFTFEWNTETTPTRARYLSRRERRRHLAGQHDQRTHGRGGSNGMSALRGAEADEIPAPGAGWARMSPKGFARIYAEDGGEGLATLAKGDAGGVLWTGEYVGRRTLVNSQVFAARDKQGNLLTVQIPRNLNISDADKAGTLDTVIGLRDRYPHTGATTGRLSVYVKSELNMGSGTFGRTEGLSSLHGFTISLNEGMYRTGSKTQAVMQEAQASGWHRKIAGRPLYEPVIVHEYGHTQTLRPAPGSQTGVDFNSRGASALDKIRMKGEGASIGLTGYSTRNGFEMLAEGFEDMHYGHHNAVSDALREVLG